MNMMEVDGTNYLQKEHFDVFYIGLMRFYLLLAFGFLKDGLGSYASRFLQSGHILWEQVRQILSTFLQQFHVP